jgi:hypothetical protein
MRRRDVVRFATASLMLAACFGADRPAEPVWGKQPCDHCGMVMSDKRFGAESITEAGERLFFDDVGCMVLFAEEHGAFARAWVHDAGNGRWLDAQTARYAPAVGTPMDFGFDAREGDGITWSEMRVRVLAKARGEP